MQDFHVWIGTNVTLILAKVAVSHISYQDVSKILFFFTNSYENEAHMLLKQYWTKTLQWFSYLLNLKITQICDALFQVYT